MIHPRCEGITTDARTCKRPATVRVRLLGGKIASYCGSHARGDGVMRLLLPMPWEVMPEDRGKVR